MSTYQKLRRNIKKFQFRKDVISMEDLKRCDKCNQLKKVDELVENTDYIILCVDCANEITTRK